VSVRGRRARSSVSRCLREVATQSAREVPLSAAHFALSSGVASASSGPRLSDVPADTEGGGGVGSVSPGARTALPGAPAAGEAGSFLIDPGFGAVERGLVELTPGDEDGPPVWASAALLASEHVTRTASGLRRSFMVVPCSKRQPTMRRLL
jgi:hypothetical protein